MGFCALLSGNREHDEVWGRVTPRRPWDLGHFQHGPEAGKRQRSQESSADTLGGANPLHCDNLTREGQTRQLAGDEGT